MRRGGEVETIGRRDIAGSDELLEQPYLAPRRLRTAGLEQSQRLYLVCVPNTWMAWMPGKLHDLVV
jgi:hypothetical protein